MLGGAWRVKWSDWEKCENVVAVKTLCDFFSVLNGRDMRLVYPGGA